MSHFMVGCNELCNSNENETITRQWLQGDFMTQILAKVIETNLNNMPYSEPKPAMESYDVLGMSSLQFCSSNQR